MPFQLVLFYIILFIQPDDGYTQPPQQKPETKAPDSEKDNDDLDDDLFNGLNPDDGLGLGLDDL